ncbi:cytochrome c oxidase subunit 3 [Salarchaeum japonicum]|uniref:Heme-copper oxidase subunit III n=1 Tax=Salarchaeum japonicum TaxID=555573 RepID=A0AAV3T0X6_9EURY|nr:heme-copper oxidase subunit III [Salarchaeum japonicum]
MTADESGGHGFLPAVRDFPRGYGEASWWPFIGAIGASGLYLGAMLYVFAHGENDLMGSTTPGLAVFGVSAVLFVIGLFGWMYHAFAYKFWENESHNEGKSLRWGMVLFLSTDIATFGSGFAYYFFIRSGAWGEGTLPHGGIFGSLVVANTLLLILSSFTFHWAEKRLAKDDHRGFVAGLAVTLLLGIVFLGGQVYEYYEFIVHEGFTLSEGIFGSAFFGLTGLHGLHVTLGALLIAIVLFRAVRGQFSSERHAAVTTVSWYWHFVDAVWIFLVLALYVGGQLGTGLGVSL